MAPTTVTCEYPGCPGPWKSPEGDLGTVVKLLEMHFASKHQSSKNSASNSKPEKAKRPEIAAELSDEDWNYFLSRWEAYKKATSLEGEDIVLQLLECCCEELRRDHHRNYPSQTSATETSLLSEIKQIAVRAKNRAVNRVKLNTLRQDKGEPIRRFAGRIRSLATVSDYAVKCTKCKFDVIYTDEVIMDQVIAGIADLEIQKDVLSHPNAKTLTLETLLVFIEGKESGQSSLNLMTGGRGSVSAANLKEKRCRYCGDTHILGRRHCKAANHLCEKCGKTGHFTKVCKSKKPFEKPTEVKPKAEIEDKAKVEAASEFNWAAGSSWVCAATSANQDESHESDYEYSENKNFYFYKTCFNNHGISKEVKIDHKKIGATHPGQKEEIQEKIGASHPGPKKRGKTKNFKKVGSPTLDNSKSVIEGLVSLAMICLTGSAILSTFASVPGHATSSQVASVTQGSIVLGHHVHDKIRGWVRQSAKRKPTVTLESKLDMSAYKALGLKPPIKQATPSVGQHLADTGASICLGSRTYLRALGLTVQDLTPCDMTVSGANSSNMVVLGAILVEFRGPTNLKSKQIVYICEGVVGALLSLEACIDLGLVEENFPSSLSQTCHVCSTAVKQGKDEKCDCQCPVRERAPDIPTKLPMEPTVENIPRLEKWILDYYAASAFNCCECQPLPAMHGPPLKIHMQEGVTPVASHSPIPVPVHWQKKVKAGLDRDVAIGVIERVPPGTPTTWCHKMVVVPKKDNTPRRTVNFQPLNQYSSRQTHHTMSPFHQATSVPKNTKKTVLDAWNGYHSVYLDPTCRDLTTFITPWGRYRYKTTPQGYMAAGDAYTERFDRIISDIPDKTKCVDDTLMWANDVNLSFLQTCKFLTHCSRNGIVFNPSKFQFCRNEVEFAGFVVGRDSVKAAPKILESIQTFPVPKNISDIRGWFGLINQVAPFFASRPVMQPFRELLKPAAKGKQIYWDENLTKLFEDSKIVILEAIENGIKTFEVGKHTCLLTDFCKTGIGYFLMQKKCRCETISPYCCNGGWQLVLAGSRFTSDAESRYAPVEGEALAVAWALESTKHYTLGNPKLMIATDHKPLLKILADRKLEDIPNPRLVNLKEKTLRWQFSIIHIPGKIHIGPDTMSRREVTAALVSVMACYEDQSGSVERELFIENMVAANMLQPITWSRLRDHVSRDPIMKLLCDQISGGFPPDKKLLRLELREYWHHRESLSQVDGVPLYKERVIIPKSLRDEVLETLHSAHQGVTGMNERAQASVWWPGITPQIKEKRDKCKNCHEHAPSQPSSPPAPLPQPEFPFQQIVSDYFQEQGHHYLVIADRFSGWPTLLHCGGSTASNSALINSLKTYFSTYGIPEELASDGGSTYTAYQTQKFLQDYGVHHRLSSVAYPHSNQRAELAVKSMKRLLRENIGLDGKLNTDKFQRAVMQYRNTPDRDTGRSPAQVIFGRQLRDFLPAPLSRYRPHPGWLLMQEDREKALRKRALRNTESLTHSTKKLPALEVHDTVQVQNQVGCKPSRWDITGTVVEIRPYDQYVIRIHGSGRLTLRNRKFLKKIKPYCHNPHPTALPCPDPAEPDSKNITKGRDSTGSTPKQSEQVPIIDNLPEEPGVQDDVPSGPQSHSEQEPQVHDEPVVPRRSARARAEPDRLNIQSWGGQTYNTGVVEVDHYKQELPESYQYSAAYQNCILTPQHSVGHLHGLPHYVAGGGGGIAGY